MCNEKIIKYLKVKILLTILIIIQLPSTLLSNNVESNPVFDQSKLRTYSLTVLPDDWQYLQNNIIKEEYVPAELSVDGEYIGTVGIRYKGSTFTLEGCAGLREGEHCSKISMKIKFNKYDKNLRFHGLKRLNFNSMMWDPSALRERISYSVFTDMGVITSRACHAKLKINGKYHGLYSLVEQIDDGFINRNFKECNDGFLVKEKWPVTNDTSYYQKGVKNGNPKIAATKFLELFNNLNACKESELKDFIEKYMNSDYLMRYMAVDRAIANWDGVTAFYPVKNESFKAFASHNFYWYAEKERPFFWLLPWDLDGTLSINTGFDHVPQWNEIVDNPEITYSIFDGETIAVAPSSDKLMRAFSYTGRNKKSYQKAMKALLKGPFREDYLETKVEIWKKQIFDAVKNDDLGPELSVWENAVYNLKIELSLLRNRLKNRITGKKESPFVWNFDKTNDFENIEKNNFHLGLYSFSNNKSCVRISLNQENPISGKYDMRADFNMFNEIDDHEDGSNSQWVWLGSTFKDKKEVNLNSENIKGIRFTVFSDKKRKIWVSVKSNAYLKDEGGCHLGNNYDISTTPKSIEFYFKDGKFPFWMPPLEEYEIEKILTQISDFNISPVVQGLQEDGLFKKGEHDEGFVQVDDISFIRNN